ncbi:MAG: uroporphyrinogen decarboxylase family protein [Armatimonadota bacterium]|nr:uroporphyrinogen decarboxylase family protein [Armatimonadota bacterium]
MTHKERFLRTMRFQPVDHVPDEEFGYWTETLTEWHKQGLPEFVDNLSKADEYFGFAPKWYFPINLGIIPGFQYQVLEEDDRHRIIIDESGIKCMVNKDGASTIPKHLKFPIETRQDWEDFRKRLDSTNPKRYPENWEQLRDIYNNADVPVGISAGSLFGWIRNWMGFENVSYMCADDPELIEEIMEHLTEHILATIGRAVREIKFDFVMMWEDMAFNKGPMISPRLFDKWMVPRYKRITDFLKQHGCETVIVDCDGNINELVGLWLDAGVNCMFPIEVRGNSDPVAIREKYGNRVLLAGGVDKTQLIEGKESIRKEIKRIEKLVQMGGYIPHVDHRCPPNVTYENYLYYLDVKRDTFGIPRPAPYEERMAAKV